MVGGPPGAPLPLGLHDGVDGVHHGDGHGVAPGDEVPELPVPALLLVDEVHDLLELVHVEELAGLHLQPADELLELLHRQVDAVGVVELLPAVGGQLVPVEGGDPGLGVFNGIEVGAVVLRQQAEDLVLGVAGEAGDADGGLGQAAPGPHGVALGVHLVVVGIEALGQGLGVVAVQVGPVAVGLHEAEVLLGHPLGAADGGPPLVDHEGDVHGPEDLHGHVGVEDGEVAVLLLHPVLHGEEPLLLIDAHRLGGLQLLHHRGAGGGGLFLLSHYRTPPFSWAAKPASFSSRSSFLAAGHSIRPKVMCWMPRASRLLRCLGISQVATSSYWLV